MTRLGIVLPGTMSPGALSDLGRAAEEAGFESIWVSETLDKDAFTWLAFLAGKTSRIKLGTGIVSIYTRTPVLMAMSATAVSSLSGGRMVLGVGTSHPEVLRRHGLDLDRPLARMREYVMALRTLTKGDEITWEGTTYNIKGTQLASGQGFLESASRQTESHRPTSSLPIYVGVYRP